MKKTIGIAAAAFLALSSLAWAGPNEQLLAAARANDLAKMKAAVKAKASINARDKEGNTALLIAVDRTDRKREVVEYLLKSRANVNAQNRSGLTVLMAAILRPTDENFRWVQFLLTARPDVNLRDGEGKSAFFHAAQYGDTDSMALLLKAGANPNLQDSAGYSCLMYKLWAPCRPDGAVAFLIEKARIDLELKDREGMTALMHAVKVVYTHPCAQALIRNSADVNASSNNGWSVLHWAVSCQEGSGAMVAALLAAGADANPLDREGGTPLIAAVQSGNGDAATALVAAGADLERRDGTGRTALQVARAKPDTSMIRLLQAAGAADDPAILLLPSGEEIRLVDGAGNFFRGDIFFKAVVDGDLDLVNRCIALGASVNTMFEGKMPLAAAKERGRQDIVDALVSAGAQELPRKKGQ